MDLHQPLLYTTLNQIRQSPFHGNSAYIRTKLHDFFLCNLANLVINNCFNSIRLRKTAMLQMLYTTFKFIICFQHDTQIILNKRLIAVFTLMPASRTCLKGFIKRSECKVLPSLQQSKMQEPAISCSDWLQGSAFLLTSSSKRLSLVKIAAIRLDAPVL